MALFTSKKEKIEETRDQNMGNSSSSEKEKIDSKGKTSTFLNEGEHSDVLLRPRITEKATDNQQYSVYTFEVSPRSNKKTIAEAFRKIYKVNPVRVNIAKNPSKKILLRGRIGATNEVKKAYIYLKKGEKIDLV